MQSQIIGSILECTKTEQDVAAKTNNLLISKSRASFKPPYFNSSPACFTRQRKAGNVFF